MTDAPENGRNTENSHETSDDLNLSSGVFSAIPPSVSQSASSDKTDQNHDRHDDGQNAQNAQATDNTSDTDTDNAPENPNGQPSNEPSSNGLSLDTDTSDTHGAKTTPTETIHTSPPPAGDDDKAPAKKMLGEQLKDQGLISQDQLNVALHEQQKTGSMLGETLVGLGFISPDVLSGMLASSTGYEEFKPGKTMLDPDALAMVSKQDAAKYQILPVSVDEKNAVVAMSDPYDVVALDKLRQLLPRGVHIQPQVCVPAALMDTIDNVYGYASSTGDILKELAGDSDFDLQDISEDADYSHPIVRLVNALVFDAVKMGASDIHFEPEENFIRLRYRMDGILHTVQTIHKEYWSGIAQRLKIMSEMNIADKLSPQDGRFHLNVGGKEADFRVSSLPTVHGENIVLRVLDKSSGIMPLEDLGFSEHNMKLIRKAQSRPEGIIIVTGPTGSGKTTSLYSMLNTVNTVDVNIMTLEDPVEYSLPMIRQTHVKESTGLGFGDGVKALLRQDPDIIFIGEVRDGVTAEQALKAAMTGHQVYTTLHTNDCFGAIPRLLDLGLKPGMLAGAIVASFAQRLTRRLCPLCKVEKIATAEECKVLEVDPNTPPKIYEAKGCDSCLNTGYKGRVAVAEILFMDEDLDDIIAENGHKSQLKAKAREKGFKSMADDAILKILEGLTSIEAASKVVNLSDRLS